MVIIATYIPNDRVISDNHNFHQFRPQDSDDVILHEGNIISVNEAQEKIQRIIEDALANWKN